MALTNQSGNNLSDRTARRVTPQPERAVQETSREFKPGTARVLVKAIAKASDQGHQVRQILFFG
jgi:hypothetical protein